MTTTRRACTPKVFTPDIEGRWWQVSADPRSRAARIDPNYPVTSGNPLVLKITAHADCPSRASSRATVDFPDPLFPLRTTNPILADTTTPTQKSNQQPRRYRPCHATTGSNSTLLWEVQFANMPLLLDLNNVGANVDKFSEGIRPIWARMTHPVGSP